MSFINRHRIPPKWKPFEHKIIKNGFITYFRDAQKDYVYKGYWKDDKKSGFGYLIFKNEKFCYEGHFENDKFHGFGRLAKILFDGSYDPIYEGNWENGKKNGRGRWVLSENKREKVCEPTPIRKFQVLGRLEPRADESEELLVEALEQHENEADVDSTISGFIRKNLNSKLNNPHDLESSITELIQKELKLKLQSSQYLNTSIAEFIRNDLKEKLANQPRDFDYGSFWNNMIDKIENSDRSDSEVSCCCLRGDKKFNDHQQNLKSQNQPLNKLNLEKQPLNKLNLEPQSLYKSEPEMHPLNNSTPKTQPLQKSQSETLQSKLSIKYKGSLDPTKPLIKPVDNCITFKQLKQVYNEFQNRVREEKKNDTWDEFVNPAKFRSRPDPGQEQIDYVLPNFIDFKMECPKGIFYQNDNGDKLTVYENENLNEILKITENLKHKKTLGLKTVDERKLKFFLYDGYMKNDMPDGPGFGCYPDDIYYYGDWKEGKFHGKGILMALNEFSFEGDFVNGCRLGYGVYINYYTGLVQKGFYANGSFVQSTVEISPNRRQSAPYPVIYPLPDLDPCDQTVGVNTDVRNWSSTSSFDLVQNVEN